MQANAEALTLRYCRLTAVAIHKQHSARERCYRKANWEPDDLRDNSQHKGVCKRSVAIPIRLQSLGWTRIKAAQGKERHAIDPNAVEDSVNF